MVVGILVRNWVTSATSLGESPIKVSVRVFSMKNIIRDENSSLRQDRRGRSFANTLFFMSTKVCYCRCFVESTLCFGLELKEVRTYLF